jgi:proteasome lid subunit RPN8/RPN11
VLFVPRSIRAELTRHAQSGFPREICGAVLGRADERGRHVLRLVPGRNVHADPCASFELDPAAVVSAARTARHAGVELLGFYHSHPDRPALPSTADRACGWNGFLTVIVAVDGRGRTRMRGYRSQRGDLVEMTLCSAEDPTR